MSINNIVGTMKFWRGADGATIGAPRFPLDETVFEQLWKLARPGVEKFIWKEGFDRDELHLMTKDEIKATYTQTGEVHDTGQDTNQ
jgi:hypothetical protein